MHNESFGLARQPWFCCPCCDRDLPEELASCEVVGVCEECAPVEAARDFRSCAHEWFAMQAEAARYEWAEAYFGFRSPAKKTAA